MVKSNKESNYEKRVALFICGYGFGSSASIINSAVVLAQNGYKVDMLLYNCVHIDLVNFEDNRISIYILKRGPVMDTIAKEISKLRIFSNILKKIILFFAAENKKIIPANVVSRAKEIMRDKNYACFIGFEPVGLVFASIMASKTNTPVIYYSLELYLKDDPRFQNYYCKVLYKLEKTYHRKCIATIIQDENRAKLLYNNNNIKKMNTIIVPVSLLGDKIKEKGNYFQRKFDLPPNKRIILSVGGINPDRLSLEAAQSAQRLPDDWVMILHGWSNREDDEYRKKIESLVSPKLYISTDLVPFEKIPELISSADIGLVYYSDISENELNVGLASGKMAHYLQCGLPVISLNNPSLKKIVDNYHCGVCIKDPKDLPIALAKILPYMNEYKENAFKCFEENYMFLKYFEKVIAITEEKSKSC